LENNMANKSNNPVMDRVRTLLQEQDNDLPVVTIPRADLEALFVVGSSTPDELLTNLDGIINRHTRVRERQLAIINRLLEKVKKLQDENAALKTAASRALGRAMQAFPLDDDDEDVGRQSRDESDEELWKEKK
jgi:hypothetical protein